MLFRQQKHGTFSTRILCAVTPEAMGNVLKLAGIVFPVETLVGSGLLQRAQMAYVGPYLQIVEVGLAHHGRHAQASAVPCHMKLWVFLMDILCQHVDALGVGIAAHEGKAGDVLSVLFNKGIDGIGVERQSDVLPQVMAVAPRAATRTVGDVNGQRHLVGNLLEDHSRIDVLEHLSIFSFRFSIETITHARNISLLPPPVEPARSWRRASGSR